MMKTDFPCALWPVTTRRTGFVISFLPRLRCTWPSVDPQFRGVDHLRPFLPLGFDVAGKLLRRTHHRLQYLWRKKSLAECGIGKHPLHLAVDFHHDGARRAGRREKAEPGRVF